jgi:large subunit ribosomal protein L18
MKRTPLEKYRFRKTRVREKIFGTPERPRLSVYKSLKNVYTQIIDDTKGKTLAAASSLDAELKKKLKSTGNMESAALVGKMIAEKAVGKKIKKVVFDRGGRIYHGCIKAVAESARKNGLEF